MASAAGRFRAACAEGETYVTLGGAIPQAQREFARVGFDVGKVDDPTVLTAPRGEAWDRRAHRPLTPASDFSCDDIIRARDC